MAFIYAAAVVGCASSSSSPAVSENHDVFISFRGEDTRGDFTSHLHAALCRNGIQTYIDYRIQKGYEVWPQLVKAIRESTLLLVIFSENYSSSSWCLNELVELMECKKQGEEDVHVRKQSGSYHTALAKHKKDWKVSKEKMQKWKDALFEAANLSGFHSQTYRTEPDLIEDIIIDVLQKLNHRYTNDFRGLFISDENYTSIESLLKTDSGEVRVIGIWGMGGIGKTTLTAAIFHKVSSQYEGTCFLENEAEESRRHGLNYICNRLFFQVTKGDLSIDTPKMIPSTVTRRLRHKKVFIVLDDVNTPRLLEYLIGVDCDWLGAGSRVIVTTRDKHVLIRGEVDKIHKVEEMNFQNSLKLFSLNAFGITYPKKEYVESSKRAMVYAKGIPLALKVLGSFLRSKTENEWDSALSKLKKIPNTEVQAVFRLSYDGLDDDEKNIFLDIACFFKGKKSDYIGIRSLLDKALITTTSYNNFIDMHDLLQEIEKLFVKNGTGAVEGIWLDMTQITNVNLSSNAFRKMPNLRLLAFQTLNRDFERINSVYLPNGIEFFPKNLRYFGWNGYALESLPSMRYSNVEKLWHGVQNLPNLETIDLHGSKLLVECPNFQCERLPCVHPSIFSLQKLEILNVGGCTSIKSLSSNTWSQSLQRSYLEGSGLNELPPSILLIRNLEVFSFPINHGLVDLPENFANEIILSQGNMNLMLLTSLIFYDCQSLCEIPDNISLLSSLQYLGLYYSAIISLPESMKYLPRLKLLDVGECKMLQRIPALPRSTQCLHVWNCQSLRTVIEIGAKPPSEAVLKNEDASTDNDDNQVYTSYVYPSPYLYASARNGKICYYLPARRGKIRDRFHWHFTQALITIELPPNLLGFIFYLVVSQVQSCHIGRHGSIGCECYLETDRDERISITSFFVDEECVLLHPKSPFEFMADHVFLWYDAQFYKQLMEVIKERKTINDKSTSHDPKLTIQFFAQTQYNEEAVITKECGFRWMYSLEEGGSKSKRSREIDHKLEANVV
uniref:TIR domain-containing protein n=1 Tax=Glycine max TaxID=3847 RepID=A0A0R0IAY8_SOYBN